MTRYRQFAALCAVTTLALTGCAGATGGDAGGADLVIWTDNLKVTAVREVADQFQQEHGVTVDVQIVSSDLQPNFVTANAAGNGPDIVVGAHDWIGNLVQNGSIDPLPIAPEKLAETYSPKAVQATTYNQRIYGLPYGVEALVMYRNTAIVPAEPRTFDEAVDTGTAAVTAGKVDSAVNLAVGDNGDAYHMQPILTSMGGYLFGTTQTGDHDPQDLGIGGPGSIAAAKKISELGEKGRNVLRRSISTDNTIALFTAGKAAYLVSGPWALADIRAAGLDVGIQRVPGFAGQQPAAPFMGAQAFMIAANGRNKAWAQEFALKGVNTPEAMRIMYDEANLPPAMTQVATDVGAADSAIKTFNAAAEAAEPMPAIPAMNVVWEPLGQAYAQIVGGADPTTTMESAGRTIAGRL